MNGELCLSGAASQTGCSSPMRCREQTKPGWEMAADIPRDSPNAQVTGAHLHYLPAVWTPRPACLGTPQGETSRLGGSHHESSAVSGPSPSPNPLSHMFSALPEHCFKRDQLEAAGKPTRSVLPPRKVELAQEADKILTGDAEGGPLSWFLLFPRHRHPWSGGQPSCELCSSSSDTLCNLKEKKMLS